MLSPQFWVVLCLTVLFHIVVSIFLTKEIFSWVVRLKERVILTIFVWCIPFVGAFFTYRRIGSDLYGSTSNSSSGISVSLIGMDEIFNPSTKYIVEAQQEEHGEVREDNEPYKRKGFEEIIIKGKAKDVSTNA